MHPLPNLCVTRAVGMQRLRNLSLSRAHGLACKLGPSGSDAVVPVSAFVQAGKISLAFLPCRAALTTIPLQGQSLSRTLSGAEHKQSSPPCIKRTRMHIFSSASQARRESRSKWLEAAQAVAGRGPEGENNKPAQPQRFIVDGSEIHLSTSPAIPGHSVVQYKGMVEGSAVRGRSVLEIWKQQLQQQLGGEQQLLHDLLKETRTSALQRLAEAAAAAGANAVVSVRLVTSGLQSMHVEYTAYGTAVKVTKANTASPP